MQFLLFFTIELFDQIIFGQYSFSIKTISDAASQFNDRSIVDA